MENKVLIVGFFAKNKDFFNGQVVKTRLLSDYIKETYGKEAIQEIDTCGWKNKPFSFFIKVIKSYFKTDKIIVLPAHNGVKIFIPLFVCLSILKKNTIIYSVIGGWLPKLLAKDRLLLFFMKKLDIILVETSTMKKELEKLGLNNIKIMPNGKKLTEINVKDLKIDFMKPFKVCTFSRVIPEKGIEDAINAIKVINNKNSKNIYNLDIYGEIEGSYEERFKKIIDDSPDYIQYKGIIEPDKSVEILQDYYLLLFPTNFYTEGIPGTIIDAYAAGVPVISSEWQSCHDIIKPNETGLVYKFKDQVDFINVLEYASKNSSEIIKMRESCLKTSSKYKQENAFKVIDKYIF